jgi:T-complex protein 1 subunit alpha
VVIIAAELLKAADELVQKEIHPTNVINGYRLACKEAIRYLAENLSFPVEELDRSLIIRAAKTSMSSKLIGSLVFYMTIYSFDSYHMILSESDFYAELCVDAAMAVKRTDKAGKVTYPINTINVLKSHGKSSKESTLVNGYALNCTRASDGNKQS